MADSTDATLRETDSTESPISEVDVTNEETETATIIEATTLPTLKIGQCLSYGVVYDNGANVAVVNPCDENCVCTDGIVQCETQGCPPAPPNFLNCTPVQESSQCCPTYDCREYISIISTILIIEIT